MLCYIRLCSNYSFLQCFNVLFGYCFENGFLPSALWTVLVSVLISGRARSVVLLLVLNCSSPAIVAYNFWCTKNLKCLCFLSRCWNTFGLVMYTDHSGLECWLGVALDSIVWNSSSKEDLCQGYQCSGVAPTAVQYVFLKSECLLFVYIVLWGISDASEENLYISSIGLDGVYFSSFLGKKTQPVCFNPNPTNISCCCLLWSQLSSLVRLLCLLEPKIHIRQVHLLSNFQTDFQLERCGWLYHSNLLIPGQNNWCHIRMEYNEFQNLKWYQHLLLVLVYFFLSIS